MQALKTCLIEDSALIRVSLMATLEALLPVRVVGVAEDEEAAMWWLSDPGHAVDPVIVDIVLKGGSGLGLLAAGDTTPAALA